MPPLFNLFRLFPLGEFIHSNEFILDKFVDGVWTVCIVFDTEDQALKAVERRKKYRFSPTMQRKEGKWWVCITLPKEGPEPPDIEGKLEPRMVEYKGVTWAYHTARGLAKRYTAGKGIEDFDRMFVPLLRFFLDNREEWEREWATGIRGWVESF